MHKTFTLFIALTIICILLVGCGTKDIIESNQELAQVDSAEDRQKSIVEIPDTFSELKGVDLFTIEEINKKIDFNKDLVASFGGRTVILGKNVSQDVLIGLSNSIAHRAPYEQTDIEYFFVDLNELVSISGELRVNKTPKKISLNYSMSSSNSVSKQLIIFVKNRKGISFAHERGLKRSANGTCYDEDQGDIYQPGGTYSKNEEGKKYEPAIANHSEGRSIFGKAVGFFWQDKCKDGNQPSDTLYELTCDDNGAPIALKISCSCYNGACIRE